MKPLSPTARALIDAGQDLGEPAPDEKERVWSALSERLDAAPPLEARTPKPRRPWSTPATKALFAVLTVVGVGVSLLRLGPLAPTAPPPPAAPNAPSGVAPTVPAVPLSPVDPPAPASPPAERPAETPPVVAGPKPTPGPAKTRPPRPPASSPSAAASDEDRLAAELELMKKVRSALAAKAWSEALPLLDEHRRQFPEGLLRPEATVARIRCLAGSGAQAEAQALARRFLDENPGSPLADQARAHLQLEAR